MPLLAWDPNTRGHLRSRTWHQPCFADREFRHKSFMYCWRFLMAGSDRTCDLPPYPGLWLRAHPSSHWKGRQKSSMPQISEFAVYQVSTPHIKGKPPTLVKQKATSWTYNGWKRMQHTI